MLLRHVTTHQPSLMNFWSNGFQPYINVIPLPSRWMVRWANLSPFHFQSNKGALFHHSFSYWQLAYLDMSLAIHLINDGIHLPSKGRLQNQSFTNDMTLYLEPNKLDKVHWIFWLFCILTCAQMQSCVPSRLWMNQKIVIGIKILASPRSHKAKVWSILGYKLAFASHVKWTLTS
jgi:hypothetical protein